MSRIPVVWRWVLTAVIVAVAAGFALWPRGGGETASPGASAGRSVAALPAPGIDLESRRVSGVSACPESGGAPGAFAGLSLTCLADGAPVDPAILSGRPTVLNLWAYWCEPCRAELPLFQEYADRAGDTVRVITVHSDPAEEAALTLLTGLNSNLRADGRPELRLPALQDSRAAVRAAAGAPSVLPITVLIRPDGSIAESIVRPFHHVEEIAAAVAGALGVSV